MDIERVFVVGAGLMGHGIAQVSAAAEKQVTLADRTQDLADQGKARIAANLARQVEKGRIEQAAADAILGRVTTSAGVGEVGGHELVIEAVFEDEALKREIFDRGREPDFGPTRLHPSAGAVAVGAGLFLIARAAGLG